MRRCLVLMLIFLGLLAAPALAAEIRVGVGGVPTLTEAVKAARPGDTLRLANGVYEEAAEAYPIVIDKPLTLVGEPGAALKGPPFQAILKVTAPGVTVEGLGFRLLRWGVLGLADGLTVKDCRFLLADETYRVSSCGIWLAGAYDCTVADCDFSGCGLCIAGPPLSERSKGVPVLTGLFEVGEDAALFTSHAISGNTVNGKPLYYFIDEKDLTVPEDAGQAIVACCDGVSAAGLDVSDGSMGLEIVHSQGVRVQDVEASRCGVFGVYLAYIEGGAIENVVCRDANHGIDLRDVRGVSVANCEAVDCEQGIFLSWAFQCLVDECRMKGCGNGFFIASGSGNCLARSTAEANENGLYLQGEADMLLWDNDVTANTVAGVRVLKSSGRLVDNRLRGNWVGVLAAESHPLILLGNAFDGERSAALYLKDVSAAVIFGNRFAGDSKAYLELDEALEDILLCRNDFAGGPEKIVSRLKSEIDLSRNRWTA